MTTTCRHYSPWLMNRCRANCFAEDMTICLDRTMMMLSMPSFSMYSLMATIPEQEYGYHQSCCLHTNSNTFASLSYRALNSYNFSMLTSIEPVTINSCCLYCNPQRPMHWNRVHCARPFDCSPASMELDSLPMRVLSAVAVVTIVKHYCTNLLRPTYFRRTYPDNLRTDYYNRCTFA